MTAVPGALITPNVRLVRLLGQGGMGSVWVADHLTLHTQVAVKFISDDYTQDADALQRFTREATAAAKIKSPHVVQVFDHGVYAGLPYIVMELLEGEDLAVRIERAGPLPLGEMATVLQQIGKALAQAHAVGIVHRDIKPANAFLTSSGGDMHVKVLDFGVAKIMKSGQDPSYRMTQTGQLVGTPCYMSPEQVFSRGEIDFRVDLWALAVLAYETVTGDLPFQGKTLGDMYLSINSAVFTLPSRVDRVFPRALDGWFERAFAKDPKARFGSAEEMVDAFAAIAAKSPATRRARSTTTAASAHSANPHAATEASGAVALAPPSPAAGKGSRAVLIGAVAALCLGGALAAIVLLRPSSTGAVATLPATAEPVVGASATPTAPVVTAAPMPTPTVEVTASAAPEIEPAPTTKASAAARQGAAAPSTVRPATSPAPAPTGKKRRDHGF